MNEKIYIINGQQIIESEASISINDYGLMRGYAVFETIKFENRIARNLDNHISRLLNALTFIRINSV